MRNSLFLILLLSFSLSSCGLFKGLTATSGTIKNYRQLKKALEANKVDYNWLVASAKVKLKSPQLSFKGSSQLKMQKDNMVWAKVSKFGFEAARVKLNRTEMVLLNRLQQEYMERSVDKVLASFDLGVDDAFGAFQQLLLAQYPLDINGSDEVNIGTEFITIKSKHSLGEVEATINPENLKLAALQAVNEKGESVTMKYGSFKKVNNDWVPHSVFLQISGEETTQLNIDFSNIEFSDNQVIDFEIPKGYTKSK